MLHARHQARPPLPRRHPRVRRAHLPLRTGKLYLATAFCSPSSCDCIWFLASISRSFLQFQPFQSISSSISPSPSIHALTITQQGQKEKPRYELKLHFDHASQPCPGDKIASFHVPPSLTAISLSILPLLEISACQPLLNAIAFISTVKKKH